MIDEIVFTPLVDEKPVMADRIVYFKRAVELTPEEVAECKELSYGDEGYMSEILDRVMTDERRWRYRYTQVYLIKEDDKLIAWSLLEPVYRSPRYTFHCFVDPNYRRQGIGSYLITAARNVLRYSPFVYMDDDNEPFFEKYKNLITEVK